MQGNGTRLPGRGCASLARRRSKLRWRWLWVLIGFRAGSRGLRGRGSDEAVWINGQANGEPDGLDDGRAVVSRHCHLARAALGVGVVDELDARAECARAVGKFGQTS